MSTPGTSETTQYSQQYVDRVSLSRAVLAGLAGGLVFGLLIQFLMGRMTAIGAMYTLGDPSLSIGWVAHLFHSALFGGLFGFVTEREPFHSRMASGVVPAAFVGVVFAVGLWAVNVVVVWPVWLNTVGYVPGQSLSVPNLAVKPLLGHVVYGLITGGLFHVLVDY